MDRAALAPEGGGGGIRLAGASPMPEPRPLRALDAGATHPLARGGRMAHDKYSPGAIRASASVVFPSSPLLCPVDII